METVKNSAKNPNVLVVTADFGQEPTKVVPMPKEAKKPSFEEKMAKIQECETLVKRLKHFEGLKLLADTAVKGLQDEPESITLTISREGYPKSEYFRSTNETVIAELLQVLKTKLDKKVGELKTEIEQINF
jgi:hypothetical protein